MARRARAWADSVLGGAPGEEPSAPREAVPSEQVAPSEAAPPSEAVAPGEALPPLGSRIPGTRELWIRDMLSRRRGPPADWVERVRKGAPHLLERLGLQYRARRIPTEVTAFPSTEPGPEAEEAFGAEEQVSEVPPRGVETAARPPSVARAFGVQPPSARREGARAMAPEPPRAVPAPGGREGAPSAEMQPPVPSAPAWREGAPSTAPRPPAPFARAGEAPSPAGVSRAPAPEAVAREAGAPRAVPRGARDFAPSPRPAEAVVAKAPRALEVPPAEEAAPVAPVSPGPVLAPAPTEAESPAYRALQPSALEPTVRAPRRVRVKGEVLELDVRGPPVREAHPWPELPEASQVEVMDGEAALREWERLHRLDREQRGE